MLDTAHSRKTDQISKITLQVSKIKTPALQKVMIIQLMRRPTCAAIGIEHPYNVESAYKNVLAVVSQ
jgi:hypothetical protein